MDDRARNGTEFDLVLSGLRKLKRGDEQLASPHLVALVESALRVVRAHDVSYSLVGRATKALNGAIDAGESLQRGGKHNEEDFRSKATTAQQAVERLISSVVFTRGAELLRLAGDLETTSLAAKTAKTSVARISEHVEHAHELVRRATMHLEEALIRKESSKFAEAVVTDEKNARRWLGATVALAAVSAVVMYLLFDAAAEFVEASESATPPTEAAFFVLVGVRVAIVSLCVSATLWCSRGYRAVQHNRVTNQHRANALSTFSAFVRDDPQGGVVDGVLPAAVAAVFSHRATGYGPSEGVDLSARMLEFGRAVAKREASGS